MTPTPITPEARADLVRLAQGATHGVWHVWSSLYEGMKAAIVVVTPDDKSNTLFEARNYPDAAFVAAANPEAILSYEATVQALTVERDAALERVKALEAGASREEVLKAVQAVMLNLRIASNYDRDGDEEVAGAMVTNEVDRLTALFRPTSGGGTP